eukprot:TRINITY_DN17942_c0_g1_i1.p1 TRINITY_DN17942_c0_g1~~TRINITY_DN17942_c0_g1_i1.p1  ORF type:complete len:2492 (+),score=767.11 TRINITY_DN17942_c0_g1_i1:618-7478(+)
MDANSVHLLYVQTRATISEGKCPCTREEAIVLTALDAQITLHDYDPEKDQTKLKTDLKELLPPGNRKVKKIVEDVIKEWKSLVHMKELAAKHRYNQRAQSIKTFGITSFNVKIKVKKVLREEVFGVTRDSVIRLDPETKEEIQSYPLIHVKRWAATDTTLTLDFGEHQSDYLNLSTKQAREIADLISGYVEYILKAHRDALNSAGDKKSNVAQPEDAPFNPETGSRTATLVTAPGIPAGTAATGQIASVTHVAPIKFTEADIGVALHTLSLTISDMNANPSTYTRHMTQQPQYYRQQVTASYQAMFETASGFLRNMADGRQTMSRGVMQEMVRRMLQEASDLANNAKFSALSPGGHASLLGVCRNLIAALGGVIRCAGETEEGGELSAEQLNELQVAREQFLAACACVEAILSGKGMVDENSISMLIACGKTLAEATQKLMTCVSTVSGNLENGKRQALNHQAEAVVAQGNNVEDVATAMAPAVLIPACKAQIISASNLLKGELANTLKLATVSELEPEAHGKLVAECKNTNDVLQSLLLAVDSAELATDCRPDLVNSFVAAFNELNAAFAELENAVGNRAQTVNASRGIAAAVAKVIAKGKQLAVTSDPELRKKMLDSSKAIADMIGKMFQAAKESAENVDDKGRQKALLLTADHLKVATQDLVCATGQVAAAANIRYCSRGMVAASMQMVATSTNHASLVPESHAEEVASCKIHLEPLAKNLVYATKISAKDPLSTAAQVELLECAEKTSAAAQRMATAAQVVSGIIPDKESAQLFSQPAAQATLLADAAAKACVAYRDISGLSEVATICEELGALIADLDTTDIAIQSGMIEKSADAKAHEDALSLLGMSARTVIQATQCFCADARGTAGGDARHLNAQARAVNDAAAQLVNAVKAVVSTTQTRSQQAALVQAGKLLATTLQDVLLSGKLLSMKPSDATSRANLDAGVQKVATSVASMVASDSSVREIDEIIAKLDSLKGELTLGAAGGTTLDEASAQLGTRVKALNAAISQVALTVQSNPKGAVAAYKLTASALPAVVRAACVAAGATPSETTGQQVLDASNQVIDQSVAFLTLAKAHVSAAKGAVRGRGTTGVDNSLLDALRNTSAAMARLLRTLGAVSNRDCEEAIDAISDVLKDMDNLESIQPITPAVAVHQLAQVCKTLSDHHAGILNTARTDPGALGGHARATAADVRQFTAIAKAVVAKEVPYVPEKFLAPSEQFSDAVSKLVAAAGDTAQVVAAAKAISQATTVLLTRTKEEVMKMESKEKSQRLAQCMQTLGRATAAFANTAKAAIGGDAGARAKLIDATSMLREANKQLLEAVTVHPAARDALPPEKREKVLNVAREVAMTASNLIYSGMNVSAKPQNMDLLSSMTENGALAAEAIKNAIKIGTSVIPGAEQVDASVDILQNLIGDLAAASMSVAVGAMAGSNSTKASHQETEVAMVEESKKVATAISAVEAATRFTTNTTGKASEDFAFAVQQIGTLAIQAAATTANTELQGELVNNAKLLADAGIVLVQSAFTCSCDPHQQTFQEVSKATQVASQSLGQLISKINASSALLGDLDQSLAIIEKAVADINAKGGAAAPRKDATYQQCKDDLTNTVKGLSVGVRGLVSADKSNLVQLGNSAKSVAQLCTALVLSMRAASALAPSAELSAKIAQSGAALAAATLAVVQTAKAIAVDPKNKRVASRLTEAFRACNEAATALLENARRGAVGELMCDEAMTAIRSTLADLDSAALFASAGQLADEHGVSKQRLAATCDSVKGSAGALSAQCNALLADAEKLQDAVVGGSAKKVAQQLGELAGACRACAGQMRDQTAQQELLNSAKAAGIASQALILATKDARRLRSDQTRRSLLNASESVADTLGQLTRVAQAAMAESQRGAQELRAAQVSVSNIVSGYASIQPVAGATPKAVVDSAKLVLACIASVAGAIAASAQEDTARAGRQIAVHVQLLLTGTKGVHRLLPGKSQLHERLDAAVLATAHAAGELLGTAAALAAAEDHDRQALRAAFDRASAAVAKTLPNIGDCIKHYPGGEALLMEQSQKEAEELENLAEKEIRKCVAAIDEVGVQLSTSRMVQPPKAPGQKISQVEVCAIIKEGAAAISAASSAFMGHVASWQARRIANIRTAAATYRPDPVWSNGLVASAQAVMRAVQDLGAATMKPNPVEDEVVGSATGVTSATTALVNAVKAKADDGNAQEQLALQNASKAVANATMQLVAAAKKALEPAVEESGATTVITSMSDFDREIQMQIEIEKLESQLRKTRTNMQKLRKPNV